VYFYVNVKVWEKVTRYSWKLKLLNYLNRITYPKKTIKVI